MARRHQDHKNKGSLDKIKSAGKYTDPSAKEKGTHCHQDTETLTPDLPQPSLC